MCVVARRQSQPPGPRPPPKPDDGDEEETTEGRDLPPTKWLTKDGRLIGEDKTEAWPEDFTEQDGGKVDDLGEVSVYWINYDNAHFRQFLDKALNDIDKKVITEQYRIGMLVLMLSLDDAYSRMEQGDTKTQLEENIDEIRRLSAQGAATVVMTITKTLPTIINPASVGDPDDE